MICRPVSFHCWLSSSKTILINFTVTKKKKHKKSQIEKKQRRTKRQIFNNRCEYYNPLFCMFRFTLGIYRPVLRFWNLDFLAASSLPNHTRSFPSSFGTCLLPRIFAWSLFLLLPSKIDTKNTVYNRKVYFT